MDHNLSDHSSELWRHFLAMTSSVKIMTSIFRYSFTNRGEIFVKGKGMVETFLLERETDLWKNKKVLTELVHILHFRTFFSGLD